MPTVAMPDAGCRQQERENRGKPMLGDFHRNNHGTERRAEQGKTDDRFDEDRRRSGNERGRGASRQLENDVCAPPTPDQSTGALGPEAHPDRRSAPAPVARS